MRQTISSTIGAELQSIKSMYGHIEWLGCVTCELLLEDFDVIQREQSLPKVTEGNITDCKSAYDHLLGVSAPESLDDLKAAIDVVIIRQSLARTGGRVRWTPGEFQAADALTKDSGEAADKLRLLLRSGRCQIHDENAMMKKKAQEKEAALL